MGRRRLSLLLVAAMAALPALADSSGFPGTGDKAQWLKANGLYAEGNTLLHAKNYTDAVAKYKQAIEIYADDFHYHFNLGLAQKRSGHTRDALASFERAVELNRSDWKSWKGLANCHYRLGEMDEARTAFEKCLACNPPAAEVGELRRAVSACHK